MTRTELSLAAKLIKLGWVDHAGRSMQWFDWQRRGHDEQFIEARERKAGPKKFKPKEK